MHTALSPLPRFGPLLADCPPAPLRPAPGTRRAGLPQAQNRSVDLVAKEPGDAPPTTDFAKLLTDFAKNCDYKLDRTPAKAAA